MTKECVKIIDGTNTHAVVQSVPRKMNIKLLQRKNGRKKMAVISMKQLLEAGVHFGHQARRAGTQKCHGLSLPSETEFTSS